MAVYEITLTPTQEIALGALMEDWQRTQPETAWTKQLVLERLCFSTLDTTLRSVDNDLEQLRAISAQLPAQVRAQILAAMAGPLRDRLTQLLP